MTRKGKTSKPSKRKWFFVALISISPITTISVFNRITATGKIAQKAIAKTFPNRAIPKEIPLPLAE